MMEIHPIVLALLRQRGVTTEADVKEFLSPKPIKTHDPFLLLNMEAGVDLVLEEISKGKRICLYGDYDVDGITSICILGTVLSHLTKEWSYYIPSRFHEGYGLNRSATEKLKREGVDLIITVDCGSTSKREVEYAKSLGMEVIVTDHHSIMEEKADCILINPKQEGCPYPFKGLAGCGVAFKMAQAIREKSGLQKSVTNGLLDLVAIGTIGDIVPLVDENRTLAKYGLYELNKNKRIGVRKLVETVSANTTHLGSDQVAYCIVPHLNAAGRMKDASLGVELLLSETACDSEKLACELAFHNSERKRVQEETYQTCIGLKEQQCQGKVFPIIRADDAHEGITGIVAGKLKDLYGQPTIIVTPCDGALKGTGRSTDKVNMFHILDGMKDLFIRFGGHHGACGFLLPEENFDDFCSQANDELLRQMKHDPSLLDQEPEYDLPIGCGDCTKELYEGLTSMEPFGCQNRRPVFCLDQVTISGKKRMGKEGNHLRFIAASNDKSRVECILFCKADQYDSLLKEGVPLDITGGIQLNQWNGTKKIQFLVDGVREHGKNSACGGEF